MFGMAWTSGRDWIRTNSARKHRIYSPARLSNSVALPIVGQAGLEPATSRVEAETGFEPVPPSSKPGILAIGPFGLEAVTDGLEPTIHSQTTRYIHQICCATIMYQVRGSNPCLRCERARSWPTRRT